MKRKFLALCIAALAVTATGVSVIAKTSTENINVSYNNIKIVVDGKTVLTDTEPFIYNGTTYLPVRAVGEALGKEVNWDSATNTVYLGSTTGSAPTNTSTSTAINKVIYDENNLKVTYNGLSVDEYGDINVDLTLENNTGTNYSFQVREFSVNGIMFDPIFSCDVGSGKKAVDGIYLPDWDLSDIGISSVAQINDIEFSFHIYETDTWDTFVDTDLISIGF